MVSSSTTGVPLAMSSGIAQYAHSERSGRCSFAPQLGQCVLGAVLVVMCVGAEKGIRRAEATHDGRLHFPVVRDGGPEEPRRGHLRDRENGSTVVVVSREGSLPTQPTACPAVPGEAERGPEIEEGVHMNRRILTLALLASLSPIASADILVPGQILRIRFHVAVATPVPDTLLINMGIITVLQPFTVRSADVYDGTTLLGSYNSSSFGNYTGPLSMNPYGSLAAPGSLWNFDSSGTMPFTSIQNGTIQGVIDIHIQTGMVDIPLPQVNLTLQQATSANGGFVCSPAPTIDSIGIGTGTGTVFCAGDGSGTACPCGNNSPTGGESGCLSSLGQGAKLEGTGSASVSADTFVLQGSHMPNSSALYFQGTTQLAGGAGAVFGDGLRCAGGTVIRLGTKTNAGGMSQYPAAGDTLISIKGAIAAGNTRTYQVWYRNAASFCTIATFNLSNGLEVQWNP
jgi:hypothetical protein